MKQTVSLDTAFEAFYQVNPVTLITTVDAAGRLNVAAKTQFTRVGLGRFVAFGCCPEHHTYANVLAKGEFVVNFPGPDLVAEVGLAGLPFGEDVGDEVAQCGLTAIPSEAVSVPRIEECWAHLECRLVETRHYGNWTLIVGEVVAASVDETYVLPSRTEPREPGEVHPDGRRLVYPLLAYVYPDHYGVITEVKRFRFPEGYRG